MFICERCGKEFSKDYRLNVDKYRRSPPGFCSRSCANTRKKTKKIIISRYCLNCKKPIARGNYCSSKCQTEFLGKDALQIFDRWLNGEDVSKEMSLTSGDLKGNYTDSASPGNFKKKIRMFFLADQNHCCKICGNKDTWNGKELLLVLDHIDGNPSNHNKNNLRLICPNCDSQLDTYKAKNLGKGRKSLRSKQQNI
jgi:hypothetical protein